MAKRMTDAQKRIAQRDREAVQRQNKAPKPKPATKPVGRAAPKAKREESVQQKAPDPVELATGPPVFDPNTGRDQYGMTREERAHFSRQVAESNAAVQRADKALATARSTTKRRKGESFAAHQHRIANEASRITGEQDEFGYTAKQRAKALKSSKASSVKPTQPKSVVTPDMGEHRAARAEMTPAERRAALAETAAGQRQEARPGDDAQADQAPRCARTQGG